jgi:cardiolipin synthase
MNSGGMLRHLPNLVSSLRLLAAPFAAWLILSQHDAAALIVFAGAGASDALDGFIARRWGFTSQFGAWLDPAADKLLMLLSFAALYAVGATPFWLLALVIARDGGIALGWLLAKAFALPVLFEPLLIGKASTAAQIGYIFVLLLLLAFALESPLLATAGSYIVGALTLLSGIAYLLVFLRGLFAGSRIA